MKPRILFSLLCLMVLVVSCQPQAQQAQTWLDKPITTTQPGQPPAPTHKEVIQAATDTVAPVAGPWGYVISGIVTGGLLLIQHMASTKQRTSLADKVGTAVDIIDNVRTTVDAVAANTPVHPSNVQVPAPAVVKPLGMK
jgi:hypothetical protein